MFLQRQYHHLRVVTSASSGVDLTECRSKYCVGRNGPLFGSPIHNHGSFSSIYCSNKFGVAGLLIGQPPTLNTDRSITTFRFSLASITLFLLEFFTRHAVLHYCFIRHGILVTFLTCPTFLTFPKLPLEGAESCHVLN